MQLFFLVIVMWRTSDIKVNISGHKMTFEERIGELLLLLHVQRRHLHMTAYELEEYKVRRETLGNNKRLYTTTQFLENMQADLEPAEPKVPVIKAQGGDASGAQQFQPGQQTTIDEEDITIQQQRTSERNFSWFHRLMAMNTSLTLHGLRVFDTEQFHASKKLPGLPELVRLAHAGGRGGNPKAANFTQYVDERRPDQGSMGWACTPRRRSRHMAGIQRRQDQEEKSTVHGYAAAHRRLFFPASSAS